MYAHYCIHCKKNKSTMATHYNASIPGGISLLTRTIAPRALALYVSQRISASGSFPKKYMYVILQWTPATFPGILLLYGVLCLICESEYDSFFGTVSVNFVTECFSRIPVYFLTPSIYIGVIRLLITASLPFSSLYDFPHFVYWNTLHTRYCQNNSSNTVCGV